MATAIPEEVTRRPSVSMSKSKTSSPMNFVTRGMKKFRTQRHRNCRVGGWHRRIVKSSLIFLSPRDFLALLFKLLRQLDVKLTAHTSFNVSLINKIPSLTEARELCHLCDLGQSKSLGAPQTQVRQRPLHFRNTQWSLQLNGGYFLAPLGWRTCPTKHFFPSVGPRAACKSSSVLWMYLTNHWLWFKSL